MRGTANAVFMSASLIGVSFEQARVAPEKHIPLCVCLQVIIKGLR